MKTTRIWNVQIYYVLTNYPTNRFEFHILMQALNFPKSIKIISDAYIFQCFKGEEQFCTY